MYAVTKCTAALHNTATTQQVKLSKRNNYFFSFQIFILTLFSHLQVNPVRCVILMFNCTKVENSKKSCNLHVVKLKIVIEKKTVFFLFLYYQVVFEEANWIFSKEWNNETDKNFKKHVLLEAKSSLFLTFLFFS